MCTALKPLLQLFWCQQWLWLYIWKHAGVFHCNRDLFMWTLMLLWVSLQRLQSTIWSPQIPGGQPCRYLSTAKWILFHCLSCIVHCRQETPLMLGGALLSDSPILRCLGVAWAGCSWHHYMWIQVCLWLILLMLKLLASHHVQFWTVLFLEQREASPVVQIQRKETDYLNTASVFCLTIDGWWARDGMRASLLHLRSENWLSD